ncbi:MAG: hypothetical protein ACOCQX_03120 [Candidatus Nanoarchaeia archaeon]
MVEQQAGDSAFAGSLEFFARLGIYDVLLPFLLTFTIFYAILERTQVLGTEEVDGVETTKKNLNAMVAFIVGFLVVATPKMVAVINEALPHFVLLILISISFLMLVGTFYKEDDLKGGVPISDNWKIFLTVISFIGVALIFAHSIPYKGEPWLEVAWDYLINNFSSTAVSSVVMLLVVVGMMVWITRSKENGNKTEKKNGEK